MIALARREDAAVPPADVRSGNAPDRWRAAVKIRQEWLGHGLSTEPADRRLAEHSLTAIYAKTSRRRPQFVWVDSPNAAIPLVRGLPTLDGLYRRIRRPRPSEAPPAASDVAMVASRLRGALSSAVVHADPELALVRKGYEPTATRLRAYFTAADRVAMS